MNILYICADPGIPIRGAKGASIHVRALTDAFAAQGHRVTLLTPRAGDGIAPNAQVLQVPSRLIATKNLPPDVREFLAMQIADAIVRAGLELTSRERIGLIYERYSLWSDAGAQLAEVTGLPFILEVNAPLRVEAARYRTLSRERDAAEIETRMFTQAAAISVVSTPLRDYVIQHGANPARVHVLPNAVDEQYFHPAVSGKAVHAQYDLAGKFVVGFVGTVKPWHDLDILIEAVAQTAALEPFAARGSAPHLLLVGDIPDSVRARIAARGIAATIVPPIPNHDVPTHIAAMDVAVSPHPALADFYFSPLKLVEYLACGVATIAANLPPIAALVTDGVTARLYPPGNAAALAAQIAELAAHDTARMRLGWQGARYVLQNHTWRRNAHQSLGWLFPRTSARDALGAPLFDDKLRRRLFRATRADLAAHWLAAQLDESFDTVTRLEILKYKPRRRCVIAYELTRASATPGDNATRQVIGKVFKDGRGAEHLDFHRALWADGFGATASDGITIAQPLAYIPAMQMFVQERAPGATLEDSLATPNFSERVRASAAVIAKLHATRVQPPKTYTLADELAHFAEWSVDLATHKPDYALAIERQRAALNAWAETLPPVELTPVHRDFYYSQLLFADRRITLIDLDLFARADPAIDVANFAAHLRFLALDHFANVRALDLEIESFVDEYARRQSVTPAFFARLAFYETATYFRLMHVVVQRPHFADLFQPLFEITEQRITRQNIVTAHDSRLEFPMKKIPLLDLDPRYFRYLLPYRAHLALGFLTMVAVAALDIAMPWPLKFIVDNVIGGRPYSDPFSRALAEFFGDDPRWLAAFFGLAIILFTALNGALSFIFESLQGMIQSLTTFQLRSDAFAHLSNLSLQFHDHARAGEIVSRVNGDAGRVMEAFVASTGETIVNALKFAGIAGVMLFVNWRFSVIALAYAPLLLFLFGSFRRNIKSSAQVAREQEGQMLAVTHETVSAIRVVQAFGREEDEQRRFDEYGAARARAEIRAKRWEAMFEPIVDVIKAAGTAAVIWYGVAQILADQLTVGELLIFLSYLSTFYSPLKKFSKLAASLQKASVSGERLAELLDTDQVIRDAPNARALTRARGQIDFAQVSFAYDDKRPVLSDATFTALPGQMIGLVGATGAGKTTIANLLLRFYDVTAGRVALDGVDIRDLRLRDYRRQFALVPQEPILFAASIRDNIAYGAPHAQMPEIIAAARAANAHEFILKQPNGYAAEIGERGVTLSGGQRQRLAIARAILLNAPILILDEPTAALDAASEREVMQALERLMRGRTTFVIAHRLSTIRQADLILVLENGRIIERGDHANLVQRGGRYAELVRMQSGATPARTLELAR